MVPWRHNRIESNGAQVSEVSRLRYWSALRDTFMEQHIEHNFAAVFITAHHAGLLCGAEVRSATLA
jgi:hypothetical protein